MLRTPEMCYLKKWTWVGQKSIFQTLPRGSAAGNDAAAVERGITAGSGHMPGRTRDASCTTVNQHWHSLNSLTLPKGKRSTSPAAWHR